VVTDFGTRDWFDSLTARARVIRADFDPPLIIEQRVVDPRDGDVGVWQLRLASGVDVVEGRVDVPTVAFVCDRASAARLASGELNAQQAISSGALQVHGDISAVVAAAAVLARLATPDSQTRDLAQSVEFEHD
jgi:hypothetical protein